MFSRSSTSLAMPGIDDYVQLQQDFIAHTVCAKHLSEGKKNKD